MATATTKAKANPPAENTDPKASADAATPAPDAQPKPKVDKSAELAEYNTVLAAVVETRDKETGSLADEETAKLTAAYVALSGDRKSQNAAKEALMKGLSDAVDAMDKVLARAYLGAQTAIESATPTRAASSAKPVDPTEDFVGRYVATNLATQILFNTVPDGVAEDWQAKCDELDASVQDQLITYLEWLSAEEDERGDEPEVHAVVKAAVKIAAGKASGRKTSGGTRQPFTGERGDVLVHISEAFADKPVGTILKVAEIKANKSSSYGEGSPSSGAVTSRLQSKTWDVEKTGLKPRSDLTPFAVEKVADPA